VTQTLSFDQLDQLKSRGRQITQAVAGDPVQTELLGGLALLPGTWANVPDLPGHGWNMIALPFAQAPGPPFRLLLNQFNEVLSFSVVDGPVPNRGVGPKIPPDAPGNDCDQHIGALDYEQAIHQIAAEDSPPSGLAGDPQLAIHHEPGLFLNLLDQVEPGGPTIARLATIPHGDSALALGRVTVIEGPPQIPTVNALPIGVDQDVEANPYLAPYKHFHPDGVDPDRKKFRDLFDPTDPSDLLKQANVGLDIVRTTQLEFDTTETFGGIHNIPFIVRQANASEMKATFWIEELAEQDAAGNPKLRLQYLQVVQLDFFPRGDAGPGRIKWPHVSINTMTKQTDVGPDQNFAALLP